MRHAGEQRPEGGHLLALVQGLARVTISRGKIVWMAGELRTERGAGRYVKRPAFTPMFEALKRQAGQRAPQPVARAA